MKIIYHKGCADGFCAAFILNKIYPDADLFPMGYGDSADPLFDLTGEHCIADEDVIIADLSFSRKIMLAIKDIAKSVVCYDHHKTAEKELEGLDFCVFDMEKSGARLVYEHQWIQVTSQQGMIGVAYDTHIKFLVDYTEDRDLWRWELPWSKAISAAIASFPFDFKIWGGFYKGSLIQDGEAILRYQKSVIDRAVFNATEINILGYTVKATSPTALVSEIGGKLAEDAPFGLTYFITEGGIDFSLRSRGRGGEDVSAIAKHFGGGGHRNAAGFKLDFERAIRLIATPIPDLFSIGDGGSKGMSNAKTK